MARTRAADIERSLTAGLGQDSLLRRLGAAVVPGIDILIAPSGLYRVN